MRPGCRRRCPTGRLTRKQGLAAPRSSHERTALAAVASERFPSFGPGLSEYTGPGCGLKGRDESFRRKRWFSGFKAADRHAPGGNVSHSQAGGDGIDTP